MLNKKELLQIFLLFTTWRVGLFVISWLAPSFLTYQPTFPYYSDLALYNLPQWLYSWANFDGVHYLTIINKGYFGTGLIQAFFPAYPLLVKNILLHTNVIINGLLWSNVFAFFCLVFLYKLAKYYLNAEQAWLVLLSFVLFPTSFFLGAFYTESLFLFFVLGSFLAAKQRNWLLAGLLAAGASATRVVGVIIVPALIIEFIFPDLTGQTLLKSFKSNTRLKKIYHSGKKRILSKKMLQSLAFILIGLSGLISYMIFLNQKFGDALYFFHVQAEFGGGRQETLITYPQVVYRYLKILLSYRPFNLNYYAYTQEFLAGTLGLLTIIWSGEKLNLSHTLFALGVFLVPTLTGTFSSMPRYLLVAWPIFIILASSLNNQLSKVLYLSISTIFLLLNLTLFIQGYWVA